MPERFSPLPDDALIFRLADPGSQFLPADAELPLPRWFEPSSGDVEEGERRNRPPGLSVWDRDRATVENARQLTQRPQGMAFGLKVGFCKSLGQHHQRELAVVADPLDARQPEPGWDGHSLVEGLKRPPGGTRQAHKDLLMALSQSCQKVD
ncbi:MAG: hypothetical protein JXB05_34310 [Myxococcaceae bacterium]|nr:hypothetical protein [Myxococcaceae bacterium]